MAGQNASKGIKGGGVVLGGSIVTVIIQILSVVILSRLISPEDFGLIAMVGVFVALGNLIRDFGLPMAALQEDNLSHQQASNLFWMNVVLAATAGAGLIVATPLIAFFYSEPRLIEIMPAMAMTVILLGVGAQLQVKLARSMRYSALVATDITSQVLGLLVASMLAYYGGGYWALIAQSLTIAVVLLIARWAVTRWKPMRFRRGHGAFGMFRSGTEYGIAHFLGFLQNNADTMIIGATLGAAPLGFYNRAYQLLTAPIGKLLSPLTQVVVPTANRIRQDKGSLVDFLLKVQFIVGSGLMFIVAIAAGMAEPLILLALGPGWDEVVLVFQILAVGGAFSVLSNVSYWAFVVTQQSNQLMKYNLLTKPMVILFVFVGSFFGLTGVAIAYVIGLAISWPINLIWLNKTAGLPGWRFFGNGIGIAIRGILVALVAWGIVYFLNLSSAFLILVIGALVSALVYILIICMSKQSRTYFFSFLTIAKSLVKK